MKVLEWITGALEVTCEYCNGTGHTEDCPANEPAWDFGDLVARPDCTGCCLAGCPDNSEVREAARRYKKWQGKIVKNWPTVKSAEGSES